MRGLVALIVVAALVAVAAFVAGNPGHVEIVWRDWQIDTSVGVLVAAAAAVALSVWLALVAVRAVWRLPRAFGRGYRTRRRRLGERATARGLIALAAGDAALAGRLARRAERLLPEAPLTLLLAAQAAQLNRDEPAARRSFTAMLARPELEIVGLRGLFGQAVQDGDDATALRLVEEARRLQPKAPWSAESLVTLEARTGQWQAAAAALAIATKQGLLPQDRARHQRGIILYELSRAAEAAGDRRRALRFAAKAQALAPDLAEPAVHHARLLLAHGRKRAASKAVERAWRTVPHPDLARVYGEIRGGETPVTRLSALQRLAAQNPHADESALTLAEAALAAQLWGEARRHLSKTAAAPSRRRCLLMALLEEREHGNSAEAREWLDRAAEAPPDPCYVCGQCHSETLEWRSLCPQCGGFGTLSWWVPTRVAAPAAAIGATPALSAPINPSTVDRLGGDGAMR